MSCRSHTLAGLTAAALCLSLLSGCGFRPLYGAANGAVTAQLSQIAVLPIPDRSGQIMRGFLLERLGRDERAQTSRYTLQVTLAERRQELAIRKDATASRVLLTSTADFVLRETKSGREILKGQSRISDAYNVLTNEFSNISAEADARRRALRELSDDIRARLAIGLEKQA